MRTVGPSEFLPEQSVSLNLSVNDMDPDVMADRILSSMSFN